jgi:hypothetical protein
MHELVLSQQRAYVSSAYDVDVLKANVRVDQDGSAQQGVQGRVERARSKRSYCERYQADG